jgi:hypothetical protein
MKNKVVDVDENTVGIVVNSPKHGDHVSLIDREDLPRFNAFDNWCIHKRPETTYYLMTKIGYDYTGFQSNIVAHRLAMSFPILNVDHINGDGLDNRKCNLREVSHAQNMWNRKITTKAETMFKGVHFIKKAIKNPWIGLIRHNNKNIYLGVFKTDIEAALAYNKKALELFGEYARINEIN